LRYLFLEVTRRCNLSCAYCGSSCTGAEQAPEMPASRFVEVIRQIAADFPARSIMVAVTGGEPLLKRGILDIFQALHEAGFPYGMVTNGWLLDGKVARALVALGMGSISVSMDALPEVNDRLRGAGTSAASAAAVAALREAGYTGKLEILSTLTTPALAQLDAMRAHIASMRVPLWRVAPVMPIGRAAERPDLVPDAGQVRGLLEWVRRARKDGRLPVPELSEEGFLGWRFEGVVRPYLAQCRAGTEVAGIKADGTIGACPELGPAFDQGHVDRDRFKDVWEQRYGNLRDRSWTRTAGPCADCEHWAWCRGGAMHLYERPGAPFLRCLYLQCKQVETGDLVP
jgi:radical SAM protein with 4Fe4S-binding SPASM domain